MAAKSLVFLLLSAALLQAQEGYWLTANQVRVDLAGHWQAWEAGTGTLVIGEDGTVRPRFLRRDLNAVANAVEFESVDSRGDTLTGGIRYAGSSRETAELVMDGDPNTWWEPARKDSVDRWYLDIDLGRTVIARRVVVRFAEGGDPFLKFRVMLSDGREKRKGYEGLAFYRAGQVTWRNKDQRVFEFEVQPRSPRAEGVEGEVAQVVRVEALDSDGPRGEEVNVQAYQYLPFEDLGTIDFFRQTATGRQIRVDEETYVELPEEEKGPVRYYRRERPKLAEVEVYSLGDNIVTLTQRQLFQDVNLFENIQRQLLTDGFLRSGYPIAVFNPLKDRGQLEIDLGARFWLDNIRLLSLGDPPVAYQLRVSDGSLEPTGELLWHAFDEQINRERFLQLEERFQPREVRFIEFRRLELVGSVYEVANLGEIQAYGEGYVSEVKLLSPLIRLGRSRMVRAVTWEGEASVDTRVEIRTRSGDELRQTIEYYDHRGRQISKKEWDALKNWFKKEPVIREEIASDWSDWSELYRTSGETFRSPSPRRFFQAQVVLRTRNPLRASSIKSLRFDLAPPLVEQAFAEIWPVREVRPGVDQEFTLYLRPNFRAGDTGFDRIRLRSSSQAPIELLSLRSRPVGRDLWPGAGPVERIEEGGVEMEDLWPGKVWMERTEEGGVAMVFPEPIESGGRVYAIRFNTRLFLNGTIFIAELGHASRPGVVQAATQGNASSLVGSQSLVVIAELEESSLLEDVRVAPQVFTPNGDGVNDRAEVRFSVFRIKGERLLRVDLFDLSGRRVRDLSAQRNPPSGEYAVAWDGRDERGGLVRPGAYLARVRFSVDEEGKDTEAVRVVHVAY